MPSILRVGRYVIFFWSNENDEPVHVHIAVKRPHANATKVWLTEGRGVILANNDDDIPQKDLNLLLEIIQAQFDDIVDAWKKFFLTDIVCFYC